MSAAPIPNLSQLPDFNRLKGSVVELAATAVKDGERQLPPWRVLAPLLHRACPPAVAV